MNDAKTGLSARLFSGARERDGASSVSVLSGAARRLLAQALCATPAPATMRDLHTTLRKVGTRIGVGEMVYNRVSALPQAQMRDSGALNLDYLCELAGVERAQVKHDSGPVKLQAPRVTTCTVARSDAVQSTRTVRPSAATPVSRTAVTYGPSPRPAPPPRPVKDGVDKKPPRPAAKADHSASDNPTVAPQRTVKEEVATRSPRPVSNPQHAVEPQPVRTPAVRPLPIPTQSVPSAPPVADTRPVVTTTPKRASAWRSMRTMLRMLEKEFNWPKGAGLPTWACYFVLQWQRRISHAPNALVQMREQGLLHAPSTSPMYMGQYLWTICDVRVVTRGTDVPDVPEAELRAQIRYALFYHGDRIRRLRDFKGVKIPKHPK